MRSHTARFGSRTLQALLAVLVALASLAAPTAALAGSDAPPDSHDTAAQPHGSIRLPASAPLIGTGEDAYSVDRLYLAYFLRDPDPDGLQYWLDRYRAGMSLAQISEAFASSREFQTRYGAVTSGQFVRLVYQNVLQREPDNGGFDHWTGQLAGGLPRGSMMIGFSDSGEFKAATDLVGSGPDTLSVERLYRAYFRRDGDESGLAHWKAQYTDLASLLAISAAFEGSREFRTTYGALNDAAFVALVYQNVLGRDPDHAGGSYWRERLAVGVSRGAMMVGFSDSAEFKRTGAIPGGGGSDGGGDGDGDQCPTRDESDLPSAESDLYRFILLDECDAPVQWKPCERIDVVANFAGAPSTARAALLETLEKLTTATKIEWRYLRDTDERAPDDLWERPVRDPGRYGSDYAPVLVSWAPNWQTSATAYATPSWDYVPDASVGGEALRIVTGQVVIDQRWQPTNSEILVSALLHELGHLAGLDHVDDDVQTMYPIFRQRRTYAEGDLAGLARVGAWMTECAA